MKGSKIKKKNIVYGMSSRSFCLLCVFVCMLSYHDIIIS